LKRLSDRGLCGGPPDGGDDLVAYEKLAAGWQAHDCRVALRALKRFGMVPGNDSRTMFGTLLVLSCAAAAHSPRRPPRATAAERTEAGATTGGRTANGSRVRVARSTR
jgi:hypothetical protein